MGDLELKIVDLMSFVTVDKFYFIRTRNKTTPVNYHTRGFFDEEETLALGGFGRKTSKFTTVKFESWLQSSLHSAIDHMLTMLSL